MSVVDKNSSPSSWQIEKVIDMVEVDGEVDDEEEDEEELQEYNFVIDCIPENTNMLPRRFYENFSEVFYELLDIPPHLNTAGLGSDQDQRYHNILLGKIEFKHHRLDIKNDPKDWTPEECAIYVNSLPLSNQYGGIFQELNIYGEILVNLRIMDFFQELRIRTTDAIVIYSRIRRLRLKFMQ